MTSSRSMRGLGEDAWIWIEQAVIPHYVGVKVEQIDGVWQLTDLCLEAPPGRKGRTRVAITADLIRRFPLREVKEQAARNAADRQLEGALPTIYAREGRQLPREHYQQIASVYRIAVEANTPP